MDPLTLYTIGSGIYNVADGLNQKSRLLGEAATADQEAAAAKLAGEQAYAEQLDSTKFRTKQAPTRAADLTLSLAEQGLDFTRDQGQAAQAQLLAGLRDDPRNVGGLLRGLNQIGQNVQGAEQNAGRQAIAAQKIIDDSIFNQQEAERQRLANLQKTYELDPAIAAYTQATGAADAYRTAAEDASRTAIADTLAAGAQVAGQLRNTNTGDQDAAALAKSRQQFNEQQLQAQLAQPILIDDPEFYQNQMVSRPLDESDIMPVLVDEEQPVEENLGNPFATRELLQNLSTYEPATAPIGVPTLNAVNPNAPQVDPLTGLTVPLPQQDRDPYRSPSSLTPVERMEPFQVTGLGQVAPRLSDLGLTSGMNFDFEEPLEENLDPYGVNALSPTYQGQGPLAPESLENVVFGGVQGYNPLGFEQGGTYIGERGGMTGGEFDHDTNKKAIIDEESGRKEGELTGGEGVLNEDHLADIVKYIKEGDEDGLLAFLKSLLEEPQFGYDFA